MRHIKNIPRVIKLYRAFRLISICDTTSQTGTPAIEIFACIGPGTSAEPLTLIATEKPEEVDIIIFCIGCQWSA